MIPCCFAKFEWHAFEESWRGTRAHLGAMKPQIAPTAAGILQIHPNR
jgi:hypothetical protein